MNAVTFEHQGAVFCDRNGSPLTKGMNVRIQHVVGAHGRTELTEGAIEAVDIHGIQLTLQHQLRRVGRDGGVSYLKAGDSAFLAMRFTREAGALIAAHEHTDVEHGHRTFVERMDAPEAEHGRPGAPVSRASEATVERRQNYVASLEAALKYGFGFRHVSMTQLGMPGEDPAAEMGLLRTHLSSGVERMDAGTMGEGGRVARFRAEYVAFLETSLRKVAAAAQLPDANAADIAKLTAPMIERVVGEPHASDSTPSLAAIRVKPGYIAVTTDTRSAAFDDVGRDAESARLLRAAADVGEHVFVMRDAFTGLQAKCEVREPICEARLVDDSPGLG